MNGLYRLAMVGILAMVASTIRADSRVTIRVSPSVVSAGDQVRITCRVPRHPDNRSLVIVLEPFRASTRQLDGAAAMITHTLTAEASCTEAGVVEARCLVYPGPARATAQVTVAGCS